MFLAGLGKTFYVHRDQVILDQLLEMTKPERADGGEDFSFAGDSVGDHHVEGADTIRGDDEHLLA